MSTLSLKMSRMRRSTRRGRKPARPYHHGNLRRGLLDEALATIRVEGVEGLTLREIGARLGVSRTALYRHFADKRALLAAVATEGFRTLRQQLVTAWEEGGRGRAAFDSMGVAYVRFAAGNPAHYRVMFGGFVDDGPRDDDLMRESTAAFQALVDAILALQQEGAVRKDDALQLAQFIWAVVHGVSMLIIDGQLAHHRAPIDDLIQFAVERINTGVARSVRQNDR